LKRKKIQVAKWGTPKKNTYTICWVWKEIRRNKRLTRCHYFNFQLMYQKARVFLLFSLLLKLPSFLEQPSKNVTCYSGPAQKVITNVKNWNEFQINFWSELSDRSKSDLLFAQKAHVLYCFTTFFTCGLAVVHFDFCKKVPKTCL